MLDPEKDNNSKKFWKYIKSRKQDTMGIGTLKNNPDSNLAIHLSLDDMRPCLIPSQFAFL
jgi:hypothetical protein